MQGLNKLSSQAISWEEISYYFNQDKERVYIYMVNAFTFYKIFNILFPELMKDSYVKVDNNNGIFVYGYRFEIINYIPNNEVIVIMN